MKRRIMTALICLTLAASLAGCGEVGDSSSKKEKAHSSSSSEQSSSKSETESSSEPDSGETEHAGKTASAEIGKNGAKAVYKAELISEEKDIENKVTFTDMYGRHALHTAVVGLVGAPVEIDFDANEVGGGRLVFYIDKNELHGIRPDALMFMYYEEDKDNYLENFDTVIEENGDVLTASMDITAPGTYLLVNKFTWLSAWGAEVDDDGYEKEYVPGADDIAPSADWENHINVGDIITLADKDYLMQCTNGTSAVFNVSTPEQLATACYYVNCCRLDRGNPPKIEITLENDIDLKGIDWSPMGWSMAGSDHRFTGSLNGNGHTIKNLTVKDYNNAALIGESFMCSVFDIKIENADIQGSCCGVLLADDLNSIIVNVECSGKVEGSQAGSIGGGGGTSFTDCKADVKVNGEDFGSEFFSYYDMDRARVAQEYGRPEKLSVKGSVVYRDKGLEDKYDNLGWSISSGLKRNAKNETELDLASLYDAGEYTVELTAFYNGYYIPISEPVTVKVK